MKYIVFLGDGMADEKIASLGNKTPLMVADTPNMDMLAANGVCGLLKTVPEGLPASSDVANLSILGYDPAKCSEGRGVLEAAAIGVAMNADDCAMRLNIINVQNGIIKSHSSDNITTEEAHVLIDSLKKELNINGIELFAGVSYRHVLKLTDNASTHVNCQPPHDRLDQPMENNLPKATDEEGKSTEKLLREIIFESNKILENHPINLKRAEKGLQKANYCWPWSIGRKPKMESFKEKYNLNGAIISAVDLLRGIGVYAGLQPIIVEGATGLYNTNYEGKADAAVDALKENDFVFVHVEASDEASHEGNLDLKIKTIEYLDKRLIGRVLEKTKGMELTAAVLPDHYTPISIRTHSRHPVPFAICGPNHKPDSVKTFDEETCANGKYPNALGTEFMNILLTKK